MVPPGGSMHKRPYTISGSGSSYILGYCQKMWRENMEEAEAIDFVKTALREAIRFDGSSGGVIRVAVLTKDDVRRYLFTPVDDYQTASIDRADR